MRLISNGLRKVASRIGYSLITVWILFLALGLGMISFVGAEDYLE